MEVGNMQAKISPNATLCRLMSCVVVSNHTQAKLYKQLHPNGAYKLVNPRSELNKYYIVHPSAKEPNKMQATLFCNDVPYMDIIRDNMQTIAFEMVISGYTDITQSIQH